MRLKTIPPKPALNKAYRRETVLRQDMENFETGLNLNADVKVLTWNS